MGASTSSLLNHEKSTTQSASSDTSARTLTTNMNPSPPLPLPSKDSPFLDSDVTTYILEFLDRTSFITAAAVSKAFRDTIIPRQKHISLGCFRSYESMKQMGFTGATFFSGRLCELVTNEVLADLPQRYPRLVSVDLSGCRNITVSGVKNLVNGLGERLEVLVVRRVPTDYDGGDATEDIVQLVSTDAPCLKSLSLVVSNECPYDVLQTLNGNASLQSLRVEFLCKSKLEFDKRFMSFVLTPPVLPKGLSQLRHLDIQTEVQSFFDWSELTKAEYPNLVSLTITDWQQHSDLDSTLSAEYIISLLSKAPNAQCLKIRKVSKKSKLYLERKEQEQLLDAFLTSRYIAFLGADGSPSVVSFGE